MNANDFDINSVIHFGEAKGGLMNVNGFDIDGVIHLGDGKCGIHPGPRDVIITGRSFEESEETLAFLRRNQIDNHVIFNSLPYDLKTRETSGRHKGEAIVDLARREVYVNFFYEDDRIQAQEIRKIVKRNKLDTKVIFVNNPFVKKENRRHLEDL
jgi:hypothetical protein